MSADFGLVGLAVMGENLVLNVESRGFTVAVFNRTISKVDDFVNGRGKGKKFIGTHSLKDLVAALKKPRYVIRATLSVCSLVCGVIVIIKLN